MIVFQHLVMQIGSFQKHYKQLPLKQSNANAGLETYPMHLTWKMQSKCLNFVAVSLFQLPSTILNGTAVLVTWQTFFNLKHDAESEDFFRMNMDKDWSCSTKCLLKRTINNFSKTQISFISYKQCWFIFLDTMHFHLGNWHLVRWKLLSGHFSFQCHSSWNIFKVKHRSMLRSISKWWMWWDFSYNWWNLF